MPIRKIQRRIRVESDRTASVTARRPSPIRKVGQSFETLSLQRTSRSFPVAFPEGGQSDREAEVDRERGVEREPEKLRPREAPVGGEAEARMNDAAQVDVVAARARQDAGEVAVHHRVRQRQ